MHINKFNCFYLILFFAIFKNNCAQFGSVIKEFKKIASAFTETIRFNETYDDQNPLRLEYDFIIVGSGSSGSVIANRLSEIKQWNILLLEVGDVAHFLTDIPGLAAIYQFSNYNWGYLMEKEENICLGMNWQRCPYPRGKALGGSTIINYMIHVRGNKIDYDRWASLGNPGWSYNEVLPYFKKSEKVFLKHQDEGYHGNNGPLSVSDVPLRTKSSEVFLDAAKELGHEILDYNGRKQFGFSYVQSTTKNGRRCSVEKAFLRPIRKRKNLKISTRSRVTKVLIDDLKAYGVVFHKDGKMYEVKATKEVILAAGAFHSPQLLMLSGIGPKKHLEEFNIKVLRDSPVGKLMYDHVTFPGLTFTVNQPITIKQGSTQNLYNFYRFVTKNNGTVTTLGGVEALGYIKTNVSTDVADYPDVELIFIGGGLHTDYGRAYRKSFGITTEVYNAVWKTIEGKYGWSILPMLLHPKSRGYLQLRSNNPFDSPKLFGRTFSDSENKDLKTFIAAIRIIQKLAATEAFKKYGSNIVAKHIPGCEEYHFDTDYYWECALRHLATSLHHQISTCKMGPKTDKSAVVDSNLKVYGVANLRVADASVIPLTLSAHTNVPTIMIGEKAADIIKSHWLK